MFLLLGKIIFYLSLLPCFALLRFRLAWVHCMPKNRQKQLSTLKKSMGAIGSTYQKVSLWFLLRSYIKSACAHARLSQNNSQVNPRVIQGLFSVLYKTCLMSYARLVLPLIEDPLQYPTILQGYSFYARHLCQPALT